MLRREREKLSKYLDGIRNMGRLPGLMFIVIRRRSACRQRSQQAQIPIVRDRRHERDPDLITVPIAGNDDAIRAVS